MRRSSIYPVFAVSVLFTHGTEFCPIAEDSVRVLTNLASEGATVRSFTGRHCAVPVGGLPERAGPNPSLIGHAASCRTRVGAARWDAFVARWSTMQSSVGLFNRAPNDDPSTDPLVGAFCETVASAPPSGAIRWVHFGHGTSGSGHGRVEAFGSMYPASAFWALQSLLSPGQSLQLVNESCQGGALLRDALLGPRPSLEQLVSSPVCGVGMAPEGQLLSLEAATETRVSPTTDGAACYSENHFVRPTNTFARSWLALESHPPGDGTLSDFVTRSELQASSSALTRSRDPRGGASMIGVGHSPVLSSSVALTSYSNFRTDLLVARNSGVVPGCPSLPSPIYEVLRAAAPGSLTLAQAELGHEIQDLQSSLGLPQTGEPLREAVFQELADLTLGGGLDRALAVRAVISEELDARAVLAAEFCPQEWIPPTCSQRRPCSVAGVHDRCSGTTSGDVSAVCDRIQAKWAGVSQYSDLQIDEVIQQVRCRERSPSDIPCKSTKQLRAENQTSTEELRRIGGRYERLSALSRALLARETLSQMGTDLQSTDSELARLGVLGISAWSRLRSCEGEPVFPAPAGGKP